MSAMEIFRLGQSTRSLSLTCFFIASSMARTVPCYGLRNGNDVRRNHHVLLWSDLAVVRALWGTTVAGVSARGSFSGWDGIGRGHRNHDANHAPVQRCPATYGRAIPNQQTNRKAL